MKFFIILLTIISFLFMLFYLFITLVGKMIGKKTRTSDRFLWTSLKLLKTTDENVDFRRATIFLDESNLYITKHNIFKINSLLGEKNYFEFITIPLNSISVFEYYNIYSNPAVKLFTSLFNRLFTFNSYVLHIEYINENGINTSYKFSSRNISSDDFESIYIDIDHRIYKNRVSNKPVNNIEKPKIKKDDTKLNQVREDETVLLQKKK